MNLDHLRSAVGFRGYAQRDPLQEYKSESFELFQTLLAKLRQQVTMWIMRVELQEAPARQFMQLQEEQELLDINGNPIPEIDEATIASWGKVGRNQLCPCGSGLKYKHCHGRFA